jgi:hypothetical protein
VIVGPAAFGSRELFLVCPRDGALPGLEAAAHQENTVEMKLDFVAPFTVVEQLARKPLRGAPHEEQRLTPGGPGILASV